MSSPSSSFSGSSSDFTPFLRHRSLHGHLSSDSSDPAALLYELPLHNHPPSDNRMRQSPVLRYMGIFIFTALLVIIHPGLYHSLTRTTDPCIGLKGHSQEICKHHLDTKFKTPKCAYRPFRPCRRNLPILLPVDKPATVTRVELTDNVYLPTTPKDKGLRGRSLTSELLVDRRPPQDCRLPTDEWKFRKLTFEGPRELRLSDSEVMPTMKPNELAAAADMQTAITVKDNAALFSPQSDREMRFLEPELAMGRNQGSENLPPPAGMVLAEDVGEFSTQNSHLTVTLKEEAEPLWTDVYSTDKVVKPAKEPLMLPNKKTRRPSRRMSHKNGGLREKNRV